MNLIAIEEAIAKMEETSLKAILAINKNKDDEDQSRRWRFYKLLKETSRLRSIIHDIKNNERWIKQNLASKAASQTMLEELGMT